MKKILSIFFSLILLLSLPYYCAFAEEDTLSWAYYGPVMEEVFGEDARFVRIEEVDAKIWLPNFLETVALTEDDLANDAIACFMANDSSEMLYITYSDAGGISLESFQQELQKNNISSDLIRINGIPALTYFNTDSASLIVIYSTADGYFFQLICYPFSDDFFNFILSSIQPDEGVFGAEPIVPVNPVSQLISK